MELSSYLNERKKTVEATLLQLMPAKTVWPQTLLEAMHYSLMAGGKRLRPILTIAACEAVGGDIEAALPTGCAIEMIHTYSLIHDDLPAMDDDDLRRGRPTNHKVYGEAMAILAGDALLTHAYQVITETNSKHANAEQILKVINIISRYAGIEGMVSGQVVDLASEGKKISYEALQQIHLHKTARLIEACLHCGAILGKANPEQTQALAQYGNRIGLAFQIFDDILDIEGGAEMGKDIGSDVEKQKATYPSLLGMDRAKQLAHETIEQALQLLNPFDAKADPLRAIAHYIIQRKS